MSSLKSWQGMMKMFNFLVSPLLSRNSYRVATTCWFNRWWGGCQQTAQCRKSTEQDFKHLGIMNLCQGQNSWIHLLIQFQDKIEWVLPGLMPVSIWYCSFCVLQLAKKQPIGLSLLKKRGAMWIRISFIRHVYRHIQGILLAVVEVVDEELYNCISINECVSAHLQQCHEMFDFVLRFVNMNRKHVFLI